MKVQFDVQPHFQLSFCHFSMWLEEGTNSKKNLIGNY